MCALLKPLGHVPDPQSEPLYAALLARHTPELAEAIVDIDAGSMVAVLRSSEERKQLSSLKVLASIAFSSTVSHLRCEPPS